MGCVFKWCPDIWWVVQGRTTVPTPQRCSNKKDVLWLGRHKWRNDLLLDMLPRPRIGRTWLHLSREKQEWLVDGLQFVRTDVCPICAEIVETEVWPKIVECGEHLSAPEVVRGEKPPPCPICNHTELEMDWITMSTKDNKGFVHNMYISCPSCGAGMRREGTDAVSGKPKIKVSMPPKGTFEDPKEELAVAAFFRVRNLPCLDEGWEAMVRRGRMSVLNSCSDSTNGRMMRP